MLFCFYLTAHLPQLSPQHSHRHTGQWYLQFVFTDDEAGEHQQQQDPQTNNDEREVGHQRHHQQQLLELCSRRVVYHHRLKKGVKKVQNISAQTE